jgi:type II secretory pathway pseudopilin PulG
MELIVVVAVLAVMLVGVGSTLSGTLRGARKVETAANSRSEGAYAWALRWQK